MLKIRDDVDLKELEKFGYTKIDIGLNESHTAAGGDAFKGSQQTT